MTITPTIELLMLGALPCVVIAFATLTVGRLVWSRACGDVVLHRTPRR